MARAYQVAAIPVRYPSNGSVEVLLITSRETRRWVVPKGWPWRKLEDYDAAAGEAWEEAGVKGRMGRRSIGSFKYPKLRDGKPKILKVDAYILEVREEADTWPEAAERERAWFSPDEAADLVAEAGLKRLLRALPEESKLAEEPAPKKKAG